VPYSSGKKTDLSFVAAEFKQSGTPWQAVEKALSLRFLKQEKLVDGLVVNYDDRIQYRVDMVFSGK
jgi:hypothetical protein